MWDLCSATYSCIPYHPINQRTSVSCNISTLAVEEHSDILAGWLKESVLLRIVESKEAVEYILS